MILHRNDGAQNEARHLEENAENTPAKIKAMKDWVDRPTTMRPAGIWDFSRLPRGEDWY